MRFSKVTQLDSIVGQMIDVPNLKSWRGCSLVVLFILLLIGNARAFAQGHGDGMHRAPSVIYVSNAAGGITEVNSANNSAIATAAFGGNATGIAVTPDGRRLYVANGDEGQVTVIDTATNVPLGTIAAGIAGEHRSVAVTPDGAFLYVTSQVANTLTFIATATNTVVKTIPMNGEPIWVTFSPDGSRAYVSNQTGGALGVVSTAAQSVIATIPGFSLPFHSAFTSDGRYLFVSSQGDNSVKVVNPHTNAIINTIPTGPIPRKIVFSPDGSRAYVTNFGGNAVDVLDVWRQTNLGTPITVGSAPWGMAMTSDGVGYVANFNDGTISVIEDSTNSVTATLAARTYPEDVTLSTRARPEILKFRFQAIEPPGSISARASGINFQGAIVGDFVDGNGVAHGFLRTPNGSFTTLDVPGATQTFALDINALGGIAGQYVDPNGLFHGYRHAPNGVITTIDFPGAANTSVIGINAQGDIVGAYDTGDQSTNVGFLLRRGLFTSFEDPNAAPGQTAAIDINEIGLITGTFTDPAGSDHGFLLRGTNYTTIDFPGANSTSARRTNDLGTTVGFYVANSPTHGFLFDGHAFLSFDFPDSAATNVRAINERGAVVGVYRLPGSTNVPHAYLATLSEER